MVKGGVDNRSFRSQRRKKRTKKFHGRRLSGQSLVGEAADEMKANFLVQMSTQLLLKQQMKLVNFLVQMSTQLLVKQMRLVNFQVHLYDNNINNELYYSGRQCCNGRYSKDYSFTKKN